MSQAYSHATVAAAFEIAAKTTTIALTKRAFEFAILRDNQMYSYDGWSFIQHMNELWIEGEVDGQKRYRMAEHLGFGWVSGASLEVDTIVPVNYVIKTEFVNPPIPDRSKDWCAFPEGQEEAGPYGWGRTEEEAIESFMENL